MKLGDLKTKDVVVDGETIRLDECGLDSNGNACYRLPIKTGDISYNVVNGKSTTRP